MHEGTHPSKDDVAFTFGATLGPTVPLMPLFLLMQLRDLLFPLFVEADLKPAAVTSTSVAPASTPAPTTLGPEAIPAPLPAVMPGLFCFEGTIGIVEAVQFPAPKQPQVILAAAAAPASISAAISIPMAAAGPKPPWGVSPASPGSPSPSPSSSAGGCWGSASSAGAAAGASIAERLKAASAGVAAQGQVGGSSGARRSMDASAGVAVQSQLGGSGGARRSLDASTGVASQSQAGGRAHGSPLAPQASPLVTLMDQQFPSLHQAAVPSRPATAQQLLPQSRGVAPAVARSAGSGSALGSSALQKAEAPRQLASLALNLGEGGAVSG